MRFWTILIALLLPLAAGAQSLQQVYGDAGATTRNSRGALRAAGRTGEAAAGRALILPTLNLAANATFTRLDLDSKNDTCCRHSPATFARSGTR
jgi:hypothetical protein